ncbi:hypothetical protein ACFCWT_24480 [Streptomyces olivaceus]|uniref:hypothetical protein n=1 Tax=Streptomyces olivaceus TaxID=47716 RepID=UPI0035D6D601
MSAAGWIVITLNMVFLPSLSFARLGGVEWVVASTLVDLSIMIAGVWLIRRGRQHTTPLLPSLRQLPLNERVVLFLRSFKEDHIFSRSPSLWLSGTQPTPLDLLSEEDEIGRAFKPFGRMVALGSTSDRLPSVGSERHYASDGTWRAELRAALERSTLVVLAIGAGRSLAWEVNELVTRNNPTRLVLLVSRDHDRYDQFRHSLGGCFPRGLPDYEAKRRRFPLPWSRYVRAAIWFDPDWTPHWERLNLGTWPITRHRTRRALPRALRKVYERAGLPLRAAPTTPRPWAVKLGVTLISHAILAPALLLVYGSFTLLSDPSRFDAPTVTETSNNEAISEWMDRHSNPVLTGSAAAVASFSTSILLFILLAVFVYRVWQGGPLAITMARVTSIIFSFSLTLFLILLFIAMIVVRISSGPLGMSSVAAAVIPLTFAGWLNVPMIPWLLLRRDVRDWIDTRL